MSRTVPASIGPRLQGEKQANQPLLRQIAQCERQIVAAIAMAGVSRWSPHFDDAQNHSLFEIWRSSGSYSGDSSPCTWMSAVARRVTASRIVDPEAREQRRTTRLQEAAATQSNSIESPAHVVSERDQLQRVLQQLSNDHRTVLIMRHMLGYSLEEIADRLATSPKTISSRLTRAKRAALNHLDEINQEVTETNS